MQKMLQITPIELIEAKEKPLMITGEEGSLEAIFNGSGSEKSAPIIAILGHPHSLHGGTMNNKVVTTLARACRDQGIASLRFNFRGVGQSEGQFDHGIGESNDFINIYHQLKAAMPEASFIFAGFSFGAYVSYRAACQVNPSLLISVAPAVNHGDFSEFEAVPSNWHVLVAEQDEIVPQSDILTWHQSVEPAPQLHLFPEASHFFHGKLVDLKKTLQQIFLSTHFM